MSNQDRAKSIVDARWKEIGIHIHREVVLAPLFDAARETPALRQLYPSSHHDELHFSLCTQNPPSGDCPYAKTIGDRNFTAETVAILKFLEIVAQREPERLAEFQERVKAPLEPRLRELGIIIEQSGEIFHLLNTNREVIGSGDASVIAELLPKHVIPKYQVFDAQGELIGTGDVQTAIGMLLDALPPNCGPAIEGTRDDLEH